MTGALLQSGVDVGAGTRSGQLAMLDARETLGSFMTGAVPEANRFRTVIGSAIRARAANGSAKPVVRLYGEMVDLLWRDGNTDGALRLEELWNEIANDYAFSLLCAYAMANFYKSADAQRFHDICSQHTHVAPTERYVRSDDAARLLEVSVLQQRARALETEIEQRKGLEQRLRDRERAA